MYKQNKTMSINYFIIPGHGNSGLEHWQTYFEQTSRQFQRIHQVDYETPNCQDWIDTIDNAITKVDISSVVLIAHSLGCATVAHWANKYPRAIKGAFLVAPSDLEMPQYAAFPVTGFTPIPLNKLPFKSVVVASQNDIWVTFERANQFALAWGSKLINIGDKGHINTASGFGEWQEGLELLKNLD
jgi:uncharacterized protein